MRVSSWVQISTPQDKIFPHFSLAKKPKMHRPRPHFAILGYYFRWPMSVTAQTDTSWHKPIFSRHKQNFNSTNKYFTAQTNWFSQQNQILSRQKQKVHDTNKNSHGGSLSYSGNDLRAERLPSQSHAILRNRVNSMTNLSLKTSTWTVRKTLVGTMFLEALSIK